MSQHAAWDPIEIKFIMLQPSESLQKSNIRSACRGSAHVTQPFIGKVQKERSEVMYRDIFRS